MPRHDCLAPTRGGDDIVLYDGAHLWAYWWDGAHSEAVRAVRCFAVPYSHTHLSAGQVLMILRFYTIPPYVLRASSDWRIDDASVALPIPS